MWQASTLPLKYVTKAFFCLMINKEILKRVGENNQHFKNKQFTWVALSHGSLLLLTHVLISLPYAGTAVMGSCKSLQIFPSLYRNIFQYESKASLCSVLIHGIESAYVPWPFLARLTAHIYSFMRFLQSLYLSLLHIMVDLNSLFFYY